MESKSGYYYVEGTRVVLVVLVSCRESVQVRSNVSQIDFLNERPCVQAL